MDLREKLKKAAGLFVDMPDEEVPISRPASSAGSSFDAIETELAHEQEAVRTVEQVVTSSAGPSLDDAHASAMPLDMISTGTVDFPVIYQQAGIPIAAFTAEQTLEMLASMPKELPLETRRQTVNVTLSAIGKSIGANSETIVADASRKLAALAAYSESVAKHTADFTAMAELEIAALQAQMDEKRRAIQSAREAQEQVLQVCHQETDRLDDVLEFFSLDIGPSKHANGE